MRLPIILKAFLLLVVVCLEADRVVARAAEGDQISNSGWPNATNTGVRPNVKLTPSGDVVADQAGATISGLDIQGRVYIKAPNVTLIDSKVTSASFYIVRIEPGVTGTVIRNCEINGVGSGNDGSYGIVGQGTFVANNIYNVENGIGVSGSDTLIQDNYIHDLLASGSPHYDGISIDGGNSNIVIRHNTVINAHTQTSAVMIDNYFGPISNIEVDGNLLTGGGYTVYSSAQFNGGSVAGVSFTKNRMGRGKWGYSSIVKNVPVWRENVDSATGRTIGPR
ncbi:right-handed parallel beta-helix repeat-containing protein [Bradyrhizobium sp. NBAIM20]|uniref:Right handed beta helix domain-containing protein n=1 Tax=Bradyrhizobium yuanmingense TaxID=108015 RepID=A0ABV4GR50_9BRAD|nr:MULTISPECIES: right-handed parallel beta-helix repeat-containing protein [Bradyrhizobium]MCA1413390.1 right-handed parallel beta-helix repeat-containing protein [Bradyrhizobium sp. NBAIM20]MCA1466035.1 right-handed parallel beta-helix repeat-containing protein [Bradyrhizobium sp. NBAIM18]